MKAQEYRDLQSDVGDTICSVMSAATPEERRSECARLKRKMIELEAATTTNRRDKVKTLLFIQKANELIGENRAN